MTDHHLQVCTACGVTGYPSKRVKGGFATEVVLWLCFVVPGILYSVWRLSTKESICNTCGSPSLVPASSPVGQRIVAESSQPVTPSPASTADQLERLEALRDRGTITDAEFENARRRALGA